MSTYYVYELWNPIKLQPFYVGKGKVNKNGRKIRYYDHLSEAKRVLDRRERKSHKVNTILSILRSGYDIDFKVVLESGDEQECLSKEMELIAYYGRSDVSASGLLTNATDGGEGVKAYVYPDWLRNLRSEKSRGDNNPMYGKNHTESSRKRLSETRKARIATGEITPTRHTQLHREKLKTDNPGGRTLSKAIYAIDSSGSIARSFPSASEASREFGYISNSTIIEKATKKKHLRCSGYFWRYIDEYSEDEDFKKLDDAINCKKPVYQNNLDGSFVRWESVTLACSALGINRQSVYTSINQGYRYRGIRWSYTPPDS